jgi:REP element-mobilizing transposase RayT
MTNHIHLLCQAKKGYQLSKIVQSYKRFTTEKIKPLIMEDSRKYIAGLISTSFYKKDDNKFQLWQEYNHPEVITSEKFFSEKLNYIHDNPIRKEYVAKSEDWIYSSAGFYLTGKIGLLTIDDIESE